MNFVLHKYRNIFFAFTNFSVFYFYRPLFNCVLNIKFIRVKMENLTTAEKLLGNTEHNLFSLNLSGAELVSLVAHPSHCRSKWYRLKEVLPEDEMKSDAVLMTVAVKSDENVKTTSSSSSETAPKLDHNVVTANTEEAAVSTFTGEILIRAGPEGGQDLVEDDGREIWFDVLVGSDLPLYSVPGIHFSKFS